MFHIFFVLISLLLTPLSANNEIKLNAVFQITEGSQVGATMANPTPSREKLELELATITGNNLEKITLGLTDEQMQKIFDLTHGKVNFKGLFRTNVTDRFALNIIGGLKGFTGVNDSTVPPPFFVEPFSFLPPMDPEYKDQWWVKGINANGISEFATGQDVIIADCDAGFYWKNSDLKDNMLFEIRRDFSDLDNPLTVDDGLFPSHGTAVSAISSSILDGAGTNGIAYDSKIIPLQNYNYTSGQDDMDKEEATAMCILYAINTPGVDIILLENQTAHGSSETFIGTRMAVKLAVMSGIHVVSAAGNNALELEVEAKDDTGSVQVGAIGADGRALVFSNFGQRINVSAFGEKVYTLKGENGEMGQVGGTSAAAPMVAATLALVLELNPKLSPHQARQLLIQTRINDMTTKLVGGLLNTRAAVKTAPQIEPDLASYEESQKLLLSVQEVLSAE